MYRSVTDVVLLQKLPNEDMLSKQLLKGVNRIVLCANMENRFVLVVTQFEVLLGAVEVLLEHDDVVVF